MSGSTIAFVVIPVVVAVVLAVMIFSVYHAERHPPAPQPGKHPGHEVSGGAFDGQGGRQVMPRRDATPAEATDHAGDGSTAQHDASRRTS